MWLMRQRERKTGESLCFCFQGFDASQTLCEVCLSIHGIPLSAQHQAAFGVWGLHVELCCSGGYELLSPCIIPHSLHSSGSKV